MFERLKKTYLEKLRSGAHSPMRNQSKEPITSTPNAQLLGAQRRVGINGFRSVPKGDGVARWIDDGLLGRGRSRRGRYVNSKSWL